MGQLLLLREALLGGVRRLAGRGRAVVRAYRCSHCPLSIRNFKGASCCTSSSTSDLTWALPFLVSCPTSRYVLCPAPAWCVVDSDGFPFCKCPAGYAIINGRCATAWSWTAVGTNVVLYPASQDDPFSLTPVVIRAPPPNTSACVEIPSEYQGYQMALRIMWNVDDGVKDHLVCGKVVFWEGPRGCTGKSVTYEIPGNWTAVKPNKFNYKTTSVK
ncbi:unnamed protein product [Closterium sp. Naga37s-1]|nr:unnamed protein product [Closterium sp. Naga37s-1]